MKLDLDSAASILRPGQPLALHAKGAYLYGAPAAGNRFTAYKLALAPGDPTSYVIDGQTEKMKSHGLFSNVYQEVGEIIVADVNQPRIDELLAPDREALGRLIRKED